jgi:hypothetical protein
MKIASGVASSDDLSVGGSELAKELKAKPNRTANKESLIRGVSFV